ncbi:SDR family NAD(P)-dependent oxidoreductase [Mesorhizobium sp. Cs1299R1N1]
MQVLRHEIADALIPAFWRKMLDVNLLSAFWMTKAARSALVERQGSVVNTVSASAFARHLAKALAPRVRVNGIAPGMVILLGNAHSETRRRMRERPFRFSASVKPMSTTNSLLSLRRARRI